MLDTRSRFGGRREAARPASGRTAGPALPAGPPNRPCAPPGLLFSCCRALATFYRNRSVVPAVVNNGASGSSPFNAPLIASDTLCTMSSEILRSVACHRSAGRFEVRCGERNAGAEILRQWDQEGRLSACRIHHAKSLDWKGHVEQTLRRARCAGPHQLRHDAAHEPMVRMARCSVGSPRDHGVGTEPLQLFLHPRRQLKETRAILHVVAELCVRKPEQNRCDGFRARPPRSEPLRCARGRVPGHAGSTYARHPGRRPSR